MKTLVPLLLALAVPLGAASAQSSTAPAETHPAAALSGSWALKADGATIFRFDIERDGDGWRGTWVRPKSFASSGDSFSRLSGDTVELSSGEGKAMGEWAQLTFPDERPGAVPDIFRFRLLGQNRVEMVYADTGLAPFTLSRAAATTPLGPFEAGKVYRRVSVEMLGLPPDPADKEATPAAANPPDSQAWTLPPRRTDNASAEAGR